jgi:hypothetical protein
MLPYFVQLKFAKSQIYYLITQIRYPLKYLLYVKLKL